MADLLMLFYCAFDFLILPLLAGNFYALLPSFCYVLSKELSRLLLKAFYSFLN